MKFSNIMRYNVAPGALGISPEDGPFVAYQDVECVVRELGAAFLLQSNLSAQVVKDKDAIIAKQQKDIDELYVMRGKFETLVSDMRIALGYDE